MIRGLLEVLSGGLEASPFFALLAALGWGIISVLLSPCHLASIPLIIGFISEQEKISVGKAFRLSVLFALGILITIAAIGGVTAAMGRMLGDAGGWGGFIVAAVLFVMGLYLLDLLPMNWSGSNIFNSIKVKGYAAALVIGLIFGLALGPCTFAFMAPILGVAFRVAAGNLLLALSLVFFFGAGHCLVIVLAGTLMERVQQYLNWTNKTKAALALRKVCGALVIIGGIYLLIKSIQGGI